MSISGCRLADLLAFCTTHLDERDEIHKKIHSLRERRRSPSVESVVQTVSAVIKSAGDQDRLHDVYVELAKFVGIPSLAKCLLSRLNGWNLAGMKEDPDEKKGGAVLQLVSFYCAMLDALVSNAELKEEVDEDGTDVVLELVKVALERCLPVLAIVDGKVEMNVELYRNQSRQLLDLAFSALKLTSKLHPHHFHEHIKQKLQQTTAVVLVICGMHWRRHEWTDTSAVNVVHKLAEIYANMCEQKSIGDFLSAQSGSCRGHLGQILRLLRPYLKKDVITHAQIAMTSLHWCLQRVRHPAVGPHLPSLTPALLLSVDTQDSSMKVIGLKCMDRVINEVDPSELRLHDRADVIYAALKPQIYSNDPSVLRHLYPPLLGVIQVLEPIPQRMRQVGRRGKLDDVLSLILSSALCEGKLVLRRAHASHLHQFVAAMGIGGCKHLKRLLDLIFYYLEFPDVDLEETRLSAMRTLEVVIQQMWPRMPLHGRDIAKRIVRLIVDCSRSTVSRSNDREHEEQKLTLSDITIDHFRDFARSDSHSGLLVGSFKCLVLLLRCCGDRLKDELESVRNTKDHVTVGHIVDMAFQLM